MLRGRRLPLPQSPLSRWRTTATTPRLRRAPATASFFTTTAIRSNDNAHDEQTTAEANTGKSQAMRGAESKPRIHTIGALGDGWASLQARQSSHPPMGHIRLSLQGENNPLDDHNQFMRHRVKESAMRRSLYGPERHDPIQEAKQTGNYHFRSLWARPYESKTAERPRAGIETRQIRHEASKPRDVPQEAKRAEDYHFRSLFKSQAVEQHGAGIGNRKIGQKARKTRDVPQKPREGDDYYLVKPRPHDNVRRVIQPGKPIDLRRLWGYDNAPNEVAREHHQVPLRRALQLEDMAEGDRQETNRTPASVAKDNLRDEQLSHETLISTEGSADVTADRLQGTTAPEPGRQASDRLRPEADLPQVAMDPREGLNAQNQMPSKVKEAITRRYELVASERKPLFSPRPSVAPEALPLHLPVAAADIGPAESLQNTFAEDPVLMKAQSLAGMPPLSMRSPSRFEMHSEPRFRLVPSRRSSPGKVPKSPQPSRVKPKSLESHISELQIIDEIKLQPEQLQERPVKISDSILIEPEAINLEESEAANNTELKARGSGDESNELTEPIQPPASDNRSIFEKLFEEQERTKATDYGQQYSKLKIAEKAAKRGGPSAVVPQHQPEVAPRDAVDTKHELSIFRQLFPEQAESERAKTDKEPPRATHELLHPPEDSIMVSLRNEVRNWMSEEGQDQPSWLKPGDYGSHSTVVVISGTSPSLMDTDFYRIAPEGQHVEGWAGGLVKVIQAHDSISYEPLGQYYLMFYSRPSALAYVDEVWRLHELSRRMLHAPAGSGREVAQGPLDQAPTSPQPVLSDEERAAVRSFTLCSPHITPSISVRMWNTGLVNELAAKSNIADVLPTLRPEGSTPARALLKLTSPDGQHGEGQGGLTADELWLTLRDDGRERNAPWVLANLSEGIMPVKPKFISEHYKITVKAEPVPVSLELGDDDGDEAIAGLPLPPPRQDGKTGDAGVDRNERFRRFVLTFTQPAIARRFVRCWHKRVVYDALLDRSVVVDASAIM